MHPDPLDRLGRALRRLAGRWPRRLVLRHSGEPVALLHLEDGPEGRRCLVEEPTGALHLVRPDELESRPEPVPEALLLHLALALAASVATLTALVG